MIGFIIRCIVAALTLGFNTYLFYSGSWGWGIFMIFISVLVVLSFFRNENSIRLVSRLVSYGLQLELSKEALANQTTLLAGDRIVVSGVFESISRNALKALIEANGGKVVSSISAKTTYLVAGANMGPSKRQKAEQLNVPILTEQEFLEKL